MCKSGAAQSVICYDTLDESWTVYWKRNDDARYEWPPSKCEGKGRAASKMGTFHAIRPFIVVRNLTVGCLLGADFLTTYGAVIDYEYATLLLGKEIRTQAPLSLGKRGYQSVRVAAPPRASCSGSSSVAVVTPTSRELVRRTLSQVCG